MRSETRKFGFTLTELLVLVGVIALLVTLLFPTLIDTRSKLLEQACQANLKQWGTAFYMYSQDYRGNVYFSGTLPSWYTVNGTPSFASPYIGYVGGTRNSNGTWQTFGGILEMRHYPAVQPPFTGNAPLSYSMVRLIVVPNSTAFRLQDVKKPGSAILMLDSDGQFAFIGANGGSINPNVSSITNRHSGGVNALFADFHVEWIPYDTLATNWPTYSSPQ